MRVPFFKDDYHVLKATLKISVYEDTIKVTCRLSIKNEQAMKIVWEIMTDESKESALRSKRDSQPHERKLPPTHNQAPFEHFQDAS